MVVRETRSLDLLSVGSGDEQKKKEAEVMSFSSNSPQHPTHPTSYE